MPQSSVMITAEANGVLHALIADGDAPAFAGELIAGLSDLVTRFERGSAAALLLSSATPGSFAADVSAAVEDSTADELVDYQEAIRRPLERLAACRRLSIAAVDGRVSGLGLQLSMACSLRFCSRGSRFWISEPRHGSIPTAGVTQRLPRLIGPGRALELMLTGREIEGEEALRIGLVERLVDDDVVREARGVAESVAATAGPATGLILGCVDAALDLPYGEGLLVERAAFVEAAANGHG